MNNNLIHIKIAFLLYAFSLISCKNETSYLFPKNTDQVEIPFTYSTNGHIITSMTFSEDTLSFIIDTGSEISLVQQGTGRKYSTRKYNIRDASETIEKLSEVKIEEIGWGEVFLKNKNFATHDFSSKQYDGIIGNDILRNFCIKVDNASKKIILTLNNNIQKAKGIHLPFSLRNNSIYIDANLAGSKREFILDTGFNLELLIDSISYNNINNKDLSQKVWSFKSNTGFKEWGRSNIDSTFLILSDLRIKDKTFSDVIITYKKSIQKNIIGSTFLQRFESYTINYLDSTVCFCLASDESFIDFIENYPHAKPTAYLRLLYKCINSFGVILSENHPFTVEAVIKDELYSIIEIGDTLLGIDNTLFKEISIPNGNAFLFEFSIPQQRKTIINTLNKKNEAIFHFHKDGKLIKIKDKRHNLLLPPPTIGYSYLENEQNHFGIKIDQRDFDIYIPWLNLSFEEFKIQVTRDSIVKTITNNVLFQK